MRRAWFRATITACLAVTLIFLTLPVVAVFAQSSPRELIDGLTDPAAKDALWLSFQTTTIAILLIVLIGTPAAYLLATRDFRGRALVVTLIELPLVLPPAVAGIALLASLGPNGLMGGALDDLGIRLVLETAGVIVALVFVAAPFYIRGAQSAFMAIESSWIEASRTLGAGEARTFIRIAVPAAAPGMSAGLALAWGRALGEFGATLMFAGSFRGITQTVPLLIYGEFGTDLSGALALSAVLIAVSAAVLIAVKYFTRSAVADARR